MTATASSWLAGYSAFVTSYFVLWNVVQISMGASASFFVWWYQQRRNVRAITLADKLALRWSVSIVVPARNEALTILDTVTALLAIDYEPRELIVVNDGSSDGTLEKLRQRFHLVPAPLAFEQPLKTAAVRGVYRSIDEPDLVVIDKLSGGCKADAANAGINAASGVLVMVIDADTILETDALSRGVLPFIEDPEVVAVGGYVAIANGARIDGGRIVDAGMPANWLARFQIVEYMRSFLLFRLASASHNAVTLVSGAFGVFQRAAVIEVGGFSPTAIGEDMDLTLRLQRHFRRKKRRVRIGFVPMPVCWTQAPEDLKSLRGQRCRWRRGLLQSLWRFRGLIGNPRYGVVGLGTLPFISVFEGLGPILEVTGYLVTTTAALLGILSWGHYRILLAASVLFGAATTLFAVFLNDMIAKRYPRGRDLAILCAAAILENVGYRQLNAWWGCVGTLQAITGKNGWGHMTRRAFDQRPVAGG